MKKLLLTFSISTALLLAGCDNNSSPPDPAPITKSQPASTNPPASDVTHLHTASNGDLPNPLKKADNPKYPIGSTATITTDHMAGMEGAKATIVGAFDTVAYSISYTPTTDGDKVKDHKWIIHEEIVDAKDPAYKKGDKVMTSADHMNGMENAEVTIDSAEKTTVYMVDYQDTQNGEQVKNHKWVTEDELEK
ncbi:YdhK family protein [Oceanisphaera avium]|uniref:DUF1541 domain-containing protein n=1 Tax=Oceanisphaera avium TaxID=1903694 RepID=A0A1Y0CVH4_9GAMM|nr:YdhK family protein [Oceanisphaera avium]ART79014.1 hypothetical protein CBP12_01660 [Oceanisphaera avium]